jgi:energy-converting hydrogenase Eha subunit A
MSEIRKRNRSDLIFACVLIAVGLQPLIVGHIAQHFVYVAGWCVRLVGLLIVISGAYLLWDYFFGKKAH